jgi:hypothetical protein
MANQDVCDVTVEVELEPDIYAALQSLAGLKAITLEQLLGGMVRDDVE